jgi:hypothetical protein
MLIEIEQLAPIKNLENQVRIFIYDYCTQSGSNNIFHPVFNLLSNIIHMQYSFKEYLVTEDPEREHELSCRIAEQLIISEKELRVISKDSYDSGIKERIQDVWYSLYKAYIAYEKVTGLEVSYDIIREFKPFLKS